MKPLNLDDMKTQLHTLINEKRVNAMDCAAVVTLVLIDIAESLRKLCDGQT